MIQKYRAWILKEKKMVVVDAINFKHRHITYTVKNQIFCEYADIAPFCDEDTLVNFDDIILMQSVTCNEIDYFDGDLVIVSDPGAENWGILPIYWDDKAGALVIDVTIDDSDYTTVGWALDVGYTFKRIGNKWENPELLEDKS